MAKCRTKKVAGVKVTSPDGVVWRWMVESVTYSWCMAGQFRVHLPDGQGERLVAFMRRLDAAVGYSLGQHDMLRHVRRRGVEGLKWMQPE